MLDHVAYHVGPDCEWRETCVSHAGRPGWTRFVIEENALAEWRHRMQRQCLDVAFGYKVSMALAWIVLGDKYIRHARVTYSPNVGDVFPTKEMAHAELVKRRGEAAMEQQCRACDSRASRATL